MSRSGPPGRTAAERNSTEPQRRLGHQTKPDMGDLCPQVLAVASEAGIIRPRALAHLQQVYDRFIENGQTDWDFGGYVLTYLTRHGSRPVDGAVGERVASRMAGAS